MRIRQIVFAAAELKAGAARLGALLGMDAPYRDPGVAEFGLDNAVFVFGDQFVEIVSPTRGGTTAGRLIERRGDCGYMLILQTDDFDRELARFERLRVRRVWAKDLDDIRAKITPRTKGIMPVHLYGHPFLVDEIEAIAKEHGLAIYEDAAQAHGASWKGRPVGTIGDFAMFSLYPTKNMTSGEGGMVTCATDELARGVRLLRNQGMETQYANEVIGFNARMTDVHAAIGRVQLTKVDGWTAQRQANAAALNAGLADLAGVTTPYVAEGAVHVYHQYTIRVDAAERDRLRDALKDEHNIGSGVYYPIPNHRLPSLAHFAPGLELAETERAAREVLSLPVHPSLGEGDVDRIIAAVTAVLTAGA